MAQIAYEYKIVTGKPNDELANQLGALSSAGGWQVADLTTIENDLVVLLRREKDFEVAQSLQQALEATIEDPQSLTDAIGNHFES